MPLDITTQERLYAIRNAFAGPTHNELFLLNVIDDLLARNVELQRDFAGLATMHSNYKSRYDHE